MPNKKPFRLTEKNYFSPDRPHISNSQISDYLKSPEYYKKKYILKTIPREMTIPMKRGCIVDHLLTQSSKKNPYRVKVLKKDDPDLYEAQKEVSDDYLVTESLFDECLEIATEIKKQTFWKPKQKIITRYQTLLTGQRVGVLVCGMTDRIDVLCDQKFRLIDLKITAPSKITSPERWYWNAVEMGYFNQSALYQYLLSLSYGVPKENISCYHVVASRLQKGLVKIKIYYIPQRILNIAMEVVDIALTGIKKRNFSSPLLDWKDADEVSVITDENYEDTNDEDLSFLSS